MSEKTHIRVPAFDPKSFGRVVRPSHPGSERMEGFDCHMAIPEIEVQPMIGPRMVKVTIGAESVIVDGWGLVKAIQEANAKGSRLR